MPLFFCHFGQSDENNVPVAVFCGPNLSPSKGNYCSAAVISAVPSSQPIRQLCECLFDMNVMTKIKEVISCKFFPNSVLIKTFCSVGHLRN